MKHADKDVMRHLAQQADALKQHILSAADSVAIRGRTFYVRADGDDSADGTTPGSAWRSLAKVSSAPLQEGDGVLFRRGDIFRGQLICASGVTYAAYGEGEKPRLYGWKEDLASPGLWEPFREEQHIYHLKDRILDCGTLVFNHGAQHALKLIPSYCNGHFVCRDDADTRFRMEEEMTGDLMLFCDCRSVMTTEESHGLTFPVPKMDPANLGDLYLRCDAGNPGQVFDSIEALPGRNTIVVGNAHHVTIDNLCIRYCGAHAIGAGGTCVRGLKVTNCEIGWIGGTVQHYLGTDPNYPEGTRGSVTRYGNGIEIYGGCDGYTCENNYIYQVYDAGITHQYTVTDASDIYMRNVLYRGNLIEDCVYSIEYFLSGTKGTDSRMENVRICSNILRRAGCGWGQQRHNTWTPAHIKSWNFENPAKDFQITENCFEGSRYRLLHLCCSDRDSYPTLARNTYVQHFGGVLGTFGPCDNGLPPTHAFMEFTDVDGITGEKEPDVYYIQ